MSLSESFPAEKYLLLAQAENRCYQQEMEQKNADSANNSPSPVQPTVNLPLAYALGLIGVTIFGATLPVTRIALVDFSPWFITFARALMAGSVAILWLLLTRKRLSNPANFQLFISGLFLVIGFPAFMAIALQTVPASHGGVVLGFLPLATAIAARLVGNEKPSPRFWLLSILGASVVVSYAYFSQDTQEEAGFAPGDFWLLLAGMSASTGYALSGKLSRNMPGYEVIFRSLILNIPIVLIGALWTYEDRFLSPSITGTFALAYLGFFSMLIGFFAWNTALAMGGIARIGQIQLLQTFVTLAFAALLLAETIDATTIATAIAVTAIVALTRK